MTPTKLLQIVRTPPSWKRPIVDFWGDRPESTLASMSRVKKTKQLSLFKSELKHFGGLLLHGRRRKARPLNRKDAIHLVIRSSWAGAIPRTSLLHRSNKQAVHRILNHYAKRYRVRLYQIALVSNHIHMIIRIPDQKGYRNFIRVVTGAVAEHVMRRQSFKTFRRWVLEAGDPLSDPLCDPLKQSEIQGKGQQFWQFRPFTRILNWGRDYRSCVRYLVQNRLEALGFAPYQKRLQKYAESKNEIFLNLNRTDAENNKNETYWSSKPKDSQQM